MRRIPERLALALLLLGFPASTKAQNIVVPAGTLIHCTLEEPDFSSASANIHDPVVCPLSSLREFGQNVFPRGSYLGGHLEAAKEPGHFVGKGYLKIQFDRIGFSNNDFPVPSKLIAVKGYPVDRKGNIVGRGHATRDAVEWLFPPLWPWKVVTLPARGPRPTLKGEEPMTLRLMDDIEVPRLGASTHSYDRPPSGDRPGAAYHPQSLDRSSLAGEPPETLTGLRYLAPSGPAVEDVSEKVPAARPPESESSATRAHPVAHLKFIALKSDVVYAVASYHIEGGSLNYVRSDGAKGSVDTIDVDWLRTSQLNAERTGGLVARHTY
jgi:hypothetical protein